MKKFIFNIFYFLVIVLIFNIVVFVFANDNYYKGYTDLPDKSYKTFIIADSHGASLEKSAEKFNVYNFSSNSDSYFDMKRKITYLIENHYKINTIYITVDGHELSPYRDQINNADKSVIYTSKIDFNYLKERYLKYYFPLFQLKMNPIFRMYMEDKVKLIFHQKEKISSKIMWNELSENEKIKSTKERVLGQFPTKKRSGKLEKMLLDIIHLCKKNNIKLIGIKFPVSNSYLKISEGKNYGADQLFIDNGLKVIDYESTFTNHDDYFRDQDHLNPKGAEEFTKILFSK